MTIATQAEVPRQSSIGAREFSPDYHEFASTVKIGNPAIGSATAKLDQQVDKPQ